MDAVAELDPYPLVPLVLANQELPILLSRSFYLHVLDVRQEEEGVNVACVSLVVLVPCIAHGLHVGGVHLAGVMTEICYPTRLVI